VSDSRPDSGSADPIRTARDLARLEFIEPGPLPDSARMAEAEARLLAVLERELGVTIESPARVPAQVAAPKPATTRATTDRGRGGLRWLFASIAPASLGPVFAVAATLVVIAGTWTLLGPSREGTAPVLRGSSGSTAPGAPGAWEPRLIVAPQDGGGTRLSWSAAPRATRYTVVFLAGDLSEIARFDDLATTELVLTDDARPAGLDAGRSVLWRVTAFSGRDEVARSSASPLTLP